MMFRPCQRILSVLLILTVASCKSWRPAIFVHRSPREEYASGEQSGPAWIADGDSALRWPASVKLPYREDGVFPGGTHAAAALSFDALEGDRIRVRLSGAALTKPPVFMELHRAGATTERLLTPAPGQEFAYDVERSGAFVLLIQGRPDTTTAYTLTISPGPSLAYPTTNPAKNRIGSVWGDARDAGARKHEGVDIFAPKGSPALAAAPGRVVRLTDGGIGGKTVWLRPDGRSMSLYYAHLDSQWVREGDAVRTGDTLGQIGNTGNARFTNAHLHFGIYRSNGAVDPGPFIKGRDTAAKRPTIPVSQVGERVTLSKTINLLAAPSDEAARRSDVRQGSGLLILAGSGDFVRVRTNDSVAGWIRYAQLMKATARRTSN